MSFDGIKPQYFSLYKDNNTLDQKAENKRLKDVCNNFESVFVSKLLKSMKSTISESGLFGDGFGAKMYESMFDEKMAEQIADTGSFGISKLLYEQMLDKANANSKEGVSLEKLVKAEPTMVSVGDAGIARFDSIIDEASQKYNVPKNLVYAVIKQESAGDPQATSKAGAKGLMQLMDMTAQDLGVSDSYNPRENIFGGVKYLRGLLDRYDGDTSKALAAYNAGPSNVDKYGGIPPFKETQHYVKNVLAFTNQFQKDS